jgi:hypothetical protein
MSFGPYLVGFVILIGGLVDGAVIMHASRTLDRGRISRSVECEAREACIVNSVFDEELLIKGIVARYYTVR